MTTKEVTRRQIRAVIERVVDHSDMARDSTASERMVVELAEDILTALEDAEMIRRAR